MDLEEELEKIIASVGTKSDKARALYLLGCERTDAVELLSMTYSQAHSVWKQGGFGGDSPRGSGGNVHRGLPRSGETQPELQPGEGGSNDSNRGLRLSPSQVRYITQDGHRVIRVDTLDGAVCLQCRGRLFFALEYLGFVHADSKAEPTDMEDHYNG